MDTFDELQKNPFDQESAQKQILLNNIHYPDVFVAISTMPGIVQKTANNITQKEEKNNKNTSGDNGFGLT